MTTTHTPGPWTVRDIATASGYYVGPANDGGAPSVAFAVNRTNSSADQIAANARLIAAAPDLLAALEAMIPYATHYRAMLPLRHTGPRQCTTSDVDAARAAIAKATGVFA